MALFGTKRETKVIISGETSKYERSMRNVKRSTKSMTSSIARTWKSTASKIASSLALIGIGYGVKELVGSFLDAAKVTEDYQIRLQALLGSVEEGSRLFEEMSDYASRVPFEFEQIMTGATQLAGVMRGGVDEIKQWMPLIGDLAAVSGLSIEKTTEQVVRMYSAGAGAADLFRERGITAMMGFEAGVSYSADETRKKMMDAWNKADSQFKGVTEKLSGTWKGMLSMLSDKWFQFRNLIMDAGVFEELKKHLSDINERFGVWIKNNEAIIKQKVPEYIEKIKNALSKIWEIMSYDPAILQWGIVGLAIGGKKWGVIVGGLAHMVTWVGNLAKALGLASTGILSFSEIAKANFKELEELVERGEKRMETGKQGPFFRGKMPTMPEVTVTGEREVSPMMPFPTQEEMDKQQALWEAAQVNIMMAQQDFIDEKLKAKQTETQALMDFDSAVFDNWLLMAEEQAILGEEYAIKQTQIMEAEEEKKRRMETEGLKNFKNNLLTGLRYFANESKAMMIAYKAVAIGIAIAEGVVSAVAAFKNGMIAGGPYYGPALAATYMAASILATGAQIASIGGIQSGTSGVSVPGGGVGTYPISPDTGLPTRDGGTTLTINIEGDMIGDESYLEMLAEKISEAVENNDVRLVASEAQYAGALA